jgi:hypothetical protein
MKQVINLGWRIIMHNNILIKMIEIDNNGKIDYSYLETDCKIKVIKI